LILPSHDNLQTTARRHLQRQTIELELDLCWCFCKRRSYFKWDWKKYECLLEIGRLSFKWLHR